MTIQEQLKNHVEEKRLTYAEIGAMFKPALSRQHVAQLLSNNPGISAKTLELIDMLGFKLELRAKQ